MYHLLYSIPNKIYLTLKSARKEQRELLYLLFVKSISLFCSFAHKNQQGIHSKTKEQSPNPDLHSSHPSTVGWSDLVLFLNFEDYARLSIRYIFRSSNPKNRQFRPRMHVASTANFSLKKKTTGTLKINI